MLKEIHDTKSLLSKFGINDSEHDELDIEHVLDAVHSAQSRFGLVRIQIGALLLAVKQKEMWRGKAKSFNEYLEAEKIKASAAAQYMRVAEKLLFELKLDEAQLDAISRCSMTTLVKACSKIDKTNKDDVIALLEVLSDRDANHALDNFQEHHQSLQLKRQNSPEVKKLVNSFFNLPNDLRVDVIRQIGGRMSSVDTSKTQH